MTKPQSPPDTDKLKRESPGETSKIPDNDVGGGGRPAGKPDAPSDPNHRPGGSHPGGSAGMQRNR